MQVDYPERVEVTAGKYHFPDDGWTMYDTMDATFIFPGNKIVKFDCKSRNKYKTYGLAHGVGSGDIIFGSNAYSYSQNSSRLVSHFGINLVISIIENNTNLNEKLIQYSLFFEIECSNKKNRKKILNV